MSETVSWVASLELADAAALDDLRLFPGLELGAIASTLWLRGPSWDEPLALALRKVPGLRRFTLLAGGRLQAEGARVPEGRLPEIHWQSLRTWLAVELPPVIRPAIAPKLPLTLVRSEIEQPANALLTDIATWRDFASTAADIRLRPLRFAAARDGRVWIEGTPVPAVTGPRYYVRAGVAMPSGFAWSPKVEAVVLRRWLGLAECDVAFATEKGDWEIIRAEQFMPASRSAARLTAEALGV